MGQPPLLSVFLGSPIRPLGWRSHPCGLAEWNFWIEESMKNLSMPWYLSVTHLFRSSAIFQPALHRIGYHWFSWRVADINCQYQYVSPTYYFHVNNHAVWVWLVGVKVQFQWFYKNFITFALVVFSLKILHLSQFWINDGWLINYILVEQCSLIRTWS